MRKGDLIVEMGGLGRKEGSSVGGGDVRSMTVVIRLCWFCVGDCCRGREDCPSFVVVFQLFRPIKDLSCIPSANSFDPGLFLPPVRIDSASISSLELSVPSSSSLTCPISAISPSLVSILALLVNHLGSTVSTDTGFKHPSLLTPSSPATISISAK